MPTTSLVSTKPIAGSFFAPSRIIGDPLNEEQKIKIQLLVFRLFLTKKTKIFPHWKDQTPHKTHLFEDVFGDNPKFCSRLFNSILKTYPTDTIAFTVAKQHITRHFESRGIHLTFSDLRTMIQNPAHIAHIIGIDPMNPAQIYAAKKFMKSAIKCLVNYCDFTMSETFYQTKMIHDEHPLIGENPIHPKHRLLMKAAPIQHLDPSKTKSAFNIILSRTHVDDPAPTASVDKEFQATRKQVHDFMKGLYSELLDCDDTRHVMEALALCLEERDGHILVLSSTISELADHLGYRGNTSAPLAFYNLKSSIFLPCPFKIGTDMATRKSHFIHEALHLIMQHLINASASPVKEGSAEEKILDEALLADHKFRGKFGSKEEFEAFMSKFTPEIAAQIEQALMTFLNLELCYVHSIPPSSPELKTTWRAESIVRIMEQIAGGNSKWVQVVAPNLYKFYFNHTKPLIDAFILSKSLAGTPAAAPAEDYSEENPLGSVQTDLFEFEFKREPFVIPRELTATELLNAVLNILTSSDEAHVGVENPAPTI